MTSFQYGQILIVVALLTIGQLLFRKSALATPPLSTLKSIFALGTNPYFVLALAIYGVATLLWVAVLQKVPLSRAYAFNALGFLVVPVVAIMFYGEKATPQFGIGLVLVIAGLFLIGARN